MKLEFSEPCEMRRCGWQIEELTLGLDHSRNRKYEIAPGAMAKMGRVTGLECLTQGMRTAGWTAGEWAPDSQAEMRHTGHTGVPYAKGDYSACLVQRLEDDMKV